jgi:hypothetical protein
VKGLALAGWFVTALAFYWRGAIGRGWLGKLAIAIMVWR